MIHKVSNQSQRLLGDSEDRIAHESMNKSAMDSFSNVVVSSAQALIAKGESIKTVADKFKLKSEFLQKMLDGAAPKKLACACTSEEEEYVPEMKSSLKKASRNKNRELTEEEIAAQEAYDSLHNIKASTNPSLPNVSSKRILSGKGNDVMDTNGPQKQMGSQRNNSIWDSEVIARQSKVRTNDEILQEQNAQIAADRKQAKHTSRYETIDGQSIVDQLKGTDQRKDAGVRSAGAQEAHKYNNKLPQSGISIFDTSDFQRVPEKTAGEIRRDEIKAAAKAPKDRSWVQSGAKSVTSTDIVNSFINSMMSNKKG